MPWKFEFINEVYNYLGLARLNEFKIPTNMSILQGKQRLLTLFRLPVEKNIELQIKKTNRPESVYQASSDTTDPKTEKFKLVSRFFLIKDVYIMYILFIIERKWHGMRNECCLPNTTLNAHTFCTNWLSVIWTIILLTQPVL